jgi:SOS-response transcriptional repressor LexA
MVACFTVTPREKVEKLLAMREMSVNRLATRLGTSRQKINGWINGDTRPRAEEDWAPIAEFFGLTLSELLDPKAIPEAIAHAPAHPRRLPRTREEPSGRIKIYGAISAGTGNTSSIDAQELDVPIQFARDDYGALVIEGDSMMPFLHPSDIAIFRDWHQPKMGAVMAASTSAGDWVVKHLVYESPRYILRSLNPAYPDITEGFSIGGYLVGVVRDDGPERVIRLNAYGLRPR